MERLDGLQSPCLSLLPFCLTPHNWLPIRCEDQARACVGNFKTIATRFIHVQEECLLDGVFMWTRFDENAMFQTYIRCAQNRFTVIHGIGEMVQASLCAVGI